MKIWYDKTKLDINNFKSEKFLLLPQYSNEVINRDNDFKNNKWSEEIQLNIEYTSIEDADYILYHDKYDTGINSFSKEVHDYNHKPILAFFNDDDDRPISKTLADNIYVFRTSINKSKQSLNEFPMPAWSQDFGASTIRPHTPKPVVSFCGALTHPARYECIKNLKDNNYVYTNFIIRDSFWGGSPHNSIIREEYVDNIKESDMVLCSRGAGNFSYRLYEALSCGKIPIIIDTDISLPCYNVIDWEKFIITTPSNINKDIKKWWDNMDDKKYAEAQEYSRFIYEQYLTPSGFAKYISKHNTFKTYIRSSGMGLYSLLKDKGPIKGIEIGCYEGVNATFLLETLPDLHLTGVDPYDAYIDWNGLDVDYSQGEYKLVRESIEKVNQRFTRFNIVERTSDDAVVEFEDESVDFVFVDGLHTYEQTLQDCINYLPKVKSGGIICGHDYNIISAVTRAVNEFSAIHSKPVKALKSSTQAWYWIKD
tara:strand:- start:9562 stop:11001 length:1440 start_codon:yes stop_codon:yes gene_type:complete